MRRELFSAEAEQAVLGGLMLDNDAIDRVADILTDADFFVGDHARIYRAIEGLSREGKPIDVVTLSKRLEHAGELERIGGIAYLGTLLKNTPTAANIRHYAEIVREHKLERALAVAGDQMWELANELGPVGERLDRAQSLIMGLTETASAREPARIGTLLPQFIEELEQRHDSDAALVGLSTSLRDLDGKLSGLQPGQLIIIAGRPSMGKSAFAQQLAQHNALRGEPVAVFSLEMPKDEYVERAVVNLGRIDGQKIRTAKGLEGEDWERISGAVGRLNEAPLYIDDSADATVAQIRTKARRLKRVRGIKLIVVDYLQLMSGKGESRREEVDDISRGMKLLAKELSVPVVALAQLNRSLEQRGNKRPILSDLRESGALEQDADVVIFLYRDQVYDEHSDRTGIIELNVAKQRRGPPGTVFATWLGEHYAIADRATAFEPGTAPFAKTRAVTLAAKNDL